MLSPWTEPFDEIVDDILKHRRIQLVPNPLTITLGQN
jgi:hypothetical protein